MRVRAAILAALAAAVMLATSACSIPDDDTLALPVTARPDPWQTWWAYLGYAAVGLLLLAAIHRRQARRLRQAQRHAQQPDIELKSEAFDLEQLIDDCVGLLTPQANRKGIALVVAVSPAIPRTLVGDTLRVRQLLVNLLGNALKFTPEGEVVVRAELKRRSGEQALVRLEVNDTGVGMDEPTLQRALETFRHTGESTTRRSGGTGLGLSICKSMVEMMGGEIGASSQPAVGSTFWCEIPFGVAPQAE
jgi:signal transduction histidine kinase